MPTDEQRMREQFEADAKEALHWSTVSFDREELRPDEYAHRPMQYRWLGWLAAHRSRDAEVQALREALAALAEFTFGPEWQQPIECDQNPACEDCTIRGKAIALTGEKGSSDAD